MKPSWVFTEDHSATGSSYLVIFDSVCQLLDKPTQDFGIINVPYEPEKHVLFSERFKLCDNSVEHPGSEVSK